jgi:hypothetical protein
MKTLKMFCLITILSGGALMSTSAGAGSLYRCGNTYQDSPCAGAQNGKMIGGSSANSPSAAAQPSNAECAKRGADAQKIVWGREGGALLDQQLAKARSASEQKLINDVYSRRGTSSDIRAAIEADCVAAKEKAAKAAALLEAAGVTPQQAAAALPNKAADAGQQTANSGGADDRAIREAAQKKIRCTMIKTQLETITSMQRAGGSARDMDDLTRQKRDAENRLRSESCG